ncbi:MAG: PASTA domain-containing protein [Gemmatimonadota bacterium]|nr:PASTA domain-containing protein [Gemmatimonadota bacterium]
MGIGILLACVGWLSGYLVSTLVLFPAPPTPDDLVVVPSLWGLDMEQAGGRLGHAGLVLGSVDSLTHPGQEAGRVLGQAPLPGQLWAAGGPIRVTMSLGPERQRLPDVVELSESRARVVLETMGLRVSVDTVRAEVPRGRVIAMSPRAETEVTLPGAVRLQVSAGPPLVAMPMVLGLDEEEARAVLDSLGFIVEEVEELFRFGRDQGRVVEQEPGADVLLQRGAPVRLWVGRRGR